MIAHLLAIGTALPRYRFRQEAAADHMRRVAVRLRPGQERLLERACAGSRIAVRRTVLPDAERPPEAGEFYRPGRAPTTAERMETFAREAPALAVAAAEDALSRVPGLPREAIGHLVTVSCTGFVSPGPDVALIRALGLRPDIRRTAVGFMGCHAALNGLRAAADGCRADPRGGPALVVCVELCTLHFQQDAGDDEIIANALFADGAAAAVVSADPPAGVRPLMAMGPGATRLVADSQDRMSWRIGDTGFRMSLSADVPAGLAAVVPEVVAELAAAAGLEPDPGGFGFWALHPGGRRIVSGLADRLGLSEEQVRPTWDVLRECGNMSSPTILFILRRISETQPPAPGTAGAVLAFGPGLTVEAQAFRAC